MQHAREAQALRFRCGDAPANDLTQARRVDLGEFCDVFLRSIALNNGNLQRFVQAHEAEYNPDDYICQDLNNLTAYNP